MTAQAALLAQFTRSLDNARIPYMVVGSLASSFHGEPRMTRDIDIVIDPTEEGLRQFIGELPQQDFHVDAGAAIEALERRTSFNVIEIETGWKVDLLVRRDRQFSRVEMDRRIMVRLLGTDAHVATAEDTIIAKLEWAVAGESERQMRDVASILAVNRGRLDDSYIKSWVAALDLGDAWRRVQELALDAGS